MLDLTTKSQSINEMNSKDLRFEQAGKQKKDHETVTR